MKGPIGIMGTRKQTAGARTRGRCNLHRPTSVMSFLLPERFHPLEALHLQGSTVFQCSKPESVGDISDSNVEERNAKAS